ncbi:MAG: glycyl-radical enzyme activating protein [Clostridia bacterium]|nr:glycyl-radical enzyme activating protein [Clostridia bacterium]
MPASEELRGRIFDIQRFSLQDGSGIRTSIFFKGCPLRCCWCQNPEGLRLDAELIWMEANCIRCGTCTQIARSGGLDWQDGRLKICPQADENWDHLVWACPGGALRFSGQDYTVPQLMDVIRRDIPFYRHGTGGVTLSGGDPVMQADFAGALLAACRREGIHTALETEAALPWERLSPLLDNLDLIFVDLKLVDPVLARRYTGVGSETTKDNLRRLLLGEHRSKVTVRTPLIPGITATAANLQEAAAFLSALDPGVRWELLNYNPLAPAKYALLGRRYPLRADLTAYSREQMEQFVLAARESGAPGAFSEYGGYA